DPAAGSPQPAPPAAQPAPAPQMRHGYNPHGLRDVRAARKPGTPPRCPPSTAQRGSATALPVPPAGPPDGSAGPAPGAGADCRDPSDPDPGRVPVPSRRTPPDGWV